MPVTLLLVEGDLDAQVLASFLPVQVVPVGEKGSLRPEASRHRKRGVVASYLRDRDFDFEPSSDGNSGPHQDASSSQGDILGWRWQRHQLESYLLDPVIVARALGGEREAYESALKNAANTIRHYQAARWVVSTARRTLPPLRHLPNRPSELTHELEIPSSVNESECFDWAIDHLNKFYKTVQRVMAPRHLKVHIESRKSFFNQSFPRSAVEALTWCSGKDLLAQLRAWLVEQGYDHPSRFREHLRDWVIDNSTEALKLLPEWDCLRELVSQ
jgi:hypothetical protein